MSSHTSIVAGDSAGAKVRWLRSHGPRRTCRCRSGAGRSVPAARTICGREARSPEVWKVHRLLRWSETTSPMRASGFGSRKYGRSLDQRWPCPLTSSPLRMASLDHPAATPVSTTLEGRCREGEVVQEDVVPAAAEVVRGRGRRRVAVGAKPSAHAVASAHSGGEPRALRSGLPRDRRPSGSPQAARSRDAGQSHGGTPCGSSPVGGSASRRCVSASPGASRR